MINTGDTAFMLVATALVMLMTPGGLIPTLADVTAGSCRYPAWRLCPDEILPGPLPGVMLDEAAAFPEPALRLYQHSQGDSVLFYKSGLDVVFEQP